MNTARRAIKDTNDNKRRWRDKFQQQCADRMKNARQEKIDKRREEKWMQVILEKEWSQFKLENEKAMKQEGIINMDELIEQSIRDYQEEEDNFYLQQEQEEINNAIQQYQDSIQNIICVHCQKAYLNKSNLNNILSCPNCGFYATEQCLSQMEKAAHEHASICSGSMEYTLEPGTDNTLLAMCNVCDLWNMFLM